MSRRESRCVNQRTIATVLIVLASAAACSRAEPVPVDIVLALMRADERVAQCVSRSFQNRPQELAAKLQAERLDLNDDAEDEWRVYGRAVGCFCGNADDSCQEWVIGRFGSEYRDLKGYGMPLQSKTNGYRDLMYEAPVGDQTRWRIVYRFNGSIYEESECTVGNPEQGYRPQPCESLGITKIDN